MTLKTTLMRSAAACCAAALAALLATPAAAAAPPFGDTQVQITARETPIGAFLQDLLSRAGLTVKTSLTLTGHVNGAFQGPASKVYADVAKAFNLITYYDGVAVYIYPGTEVVTRPVNVPDGGAKAVESQVHRLGLTDAQDQIRLIDNRLVATGAERFVEQVEEVAQRYAGGQPQGSQPSYALAPAPQPLEYRVYYLRYGWAEDVTLSVGGRQVTLPGVASILRGLMTTQNGNPAPVAQRAETQNSPAMPSMRSMGGQGGSLISTSGGQQGTLGLAASANGVPPGAFNTQAWNQLADQPGAPGGFGGAMVAPQGGQDSVRVQADSRLNAIIIRDTRERLDAADQLIKALDIEPQLIEIEATIIDIDTDKVNEHSFGFNVSDPTGSGQFSIGVGGGRNANPAASGSLTSGAGGVIGGSVVGNGFTFQAGLQALVSTGAAQVVARPQIMTLSDVEAVFDNSQTFYVRVPGVEQADLFNITAGTTLRVTPHVTRDKGDNRIRLLVTVQDGSLSGQKIDKIPIVQNSGLNTQALLIDGQSLLLGGLVSHGDSKTEDKVPGLGDIPVLGFLFRSTRTEFKHTERLFLITPRLASLGTTPTAPTGSYGASNGPPPPEPVQPVLPPGGPPPVVLAPAPTTRPPAAS